MRIRKVATANRNASFVCVKSFNRRPARGKATSSAGCGHVGYATLFLCWNWHFLLLRPCDIFASTMWIFATTVHSFCYIHFLTTARCRWWVSVNSGGEIQHGSRGRMLQPVAGELERARGKLQPRPARRGGEYAGLQPCVGCAAVAPHFFGRNRCPRGA